MKTERPYPQLIISKKGSRSVQAGHPWIYDEEVLTPQDQLENGCLVDAVTENGRYLGTGLLSRKSRIRVRILSQNANDRYDEAFWRRRIQYAWNYRKIVMGEDVSCCRLIFGEADGFPGLTVDRFADLLSVQCLSYGMEKRKDLIYPLLLEVLAEDGQMIRGIYERNDNALREREGLEQGKGWFSCPGPENRGLPETEITENGIRYLVDVENGQKTGFFLDQKYNRLAVARISKGLRVLDCFTHTGSFALNAAAGGASHVTAVDISESAVKLAKENAERNGLQDRVDFLAADVFDLLPKLAATGQKPYDLIILDPPAFAKHKDALKHALIGYRRLNQKAMEKIQPGGILFTFSCSQVVSKDQFRTAVFTAAAQAGRSVKILYQLHQPADHPINIYHPEGEYLKGLVLYVE